MNPAELLELISRRADHITSAVAATGNKLDFRDKEFCPRMDIIEDCGGAFLDLAADRATIWHATGQPLHHIFHVLLHLHRYWVEGVPQLWHKKHGCTGMLFDFESTYEHLVIIPAEIAHFREAYSYWVGFAEEKLYQCQEQALSPAHFKTQLFQLFLLTQTAFARSQVSDSISEEAEKHGLKDEFSELASVIFKNYQHKAFVLESLCQYRTGCVPEYLGLRWIEQKKGGDGKQFFWASLRDYQRLGKQSGEPVSNDAERGGGNYRKNQMKPRQPTKLADVSTPRTRSERVF